MRRGVDATGAADWAGMTDCTCNGATDKTKIFRKSSSYGALLPISRGHADRDHSVIITNGDRFPVRPPQAEPRPGRPPTTQRHTRMRLINQHTRPHAHQARPAASQLSSR